ARHDSQLSTRNYARIVAFPTNCDCAWLTCGDRRCRNGARFAYFMSVVAPDVSSQNRRWTALFPLEDIAGPTSAITETGPPKGPGFFSRPFVSLSFDQ